MVDVNETRAFCPSCYRPLTSNEVAYLLYGNTRVWCECGEGCMIDTVELTLTESSAQYLDNPHDQIWYHGTLFDNWHETALKTRADIHVGESEAAWDRMASYIFRTKYATPDHFYLWSLSIFPNTPISDEIYKDYDDDETFPKDVAILYHNRWESPGSIALYLSAHYLIPISKRVISISEVEKCGSLYSLEIQPKV